MNKAKALMPLLPGVALSLALALVAATIGHFVPIVGGAVTAILLGILIRHAAGLRPDFVPGVRFTSKRILQSAVVVLGASLSLSQVWTTGSQSLLVLFGTLLVGLPVMLTLGRLMHVDRTLTRLIGVGTAICGASAIGALAPILEADEAAIAYAISTVFLFNIVAVVLFPLIGHLMGFSQHGFGVWAGTAINDTSSVVAASFSYGTAAGATAVVVKLTRTVLIVPISLIFAAVVAREQRRQSAGTDWPTRAGVPMFIILFLVASALNTTGLFDRLGTHNLSLIGQFLIVVALAAVGLSANLRAMAKTGARPLLLGLIGWVTLATVSLALQQISGLR